MEARRLHQLGINHASFFVVTHSTRCNEAAIGYHPARPFMKKIGIIVVAGFSFLLAPNLLFAQSEDPSEVFLKAYMTSQQGEKLEHENNFGEALVKLRFAGSLLEELRKNHAEWQPAIVEYRARKIGESILRVQAKLSTQKDLNANSAPSAAGIASPRLPESTGPVEPSVELVPPRPGQNRVASGALPSDAAIQEATRQLRKRVDELEAQLQKSRSDLTTAQKEKELVSGRLTETNAQLAQTQKEVEKSRQAEREVRDQLSKAQDSLGKLESSGKNDLQAQAALRDEIAQLKKALISAEADKASAEKEKDSATLQLADANKQLTHARQERDTAIAQLKGSKDAQDHVQTLIAENTDLKQKLASAEKTVREIGEDKPKKEQELADVKRQLEQLRQQLAASQKQNQDFEVTIADLRSELDDATGEVEKAKLTGANAHETAQLKRENEILRGIVIREREEEARRDQAKKLMLAEFDKLKIKSDTLTQQVQLLAQPVTKLSSEELALLRQPVVAISDNNPTALKASFAVAKNSASVPVTTRNSDRKQNSEENGNVPPAPEPQNTPGPNVETTFQPGVPKELMPLARGAKDNFDRGKYRAAEKQYRELLEKSPNNLYSLSNLGVVLFRTGKLKAAELTLKKAITIAPKDEFSRTTLGIVYYRQSKFDNALTELTKALAINPKSATAHNYLGITASQKGWQEAAEKEMLEAIAVNPDYADAHFNLAVVYATAEPPAKELAKRHYAKATSLGAEPDASLEKLMR